MSQPSDEDVVRLALWRLDYDIIAGSEVSGVHVAVADTEPWAEALVECWNDYPRILAERDRLIEGAANVGMERDQANARTAELERERDEARSEMAACPECGIVPHPHYHEEPTDD